MVPLTPEDILPLDVFAARRSELFHAHLRYLDRYRRVRVGPCLTLVFENRQTLWFRVQEVLRVARLAEPERVRAELDWYNQLLPREGRLQAALLIAADPARPVESLAEWADLTGDAIRFRIGDFTVPGELTTCRPEDRAVGGAYWIEFPFDERSQAALADSRWPARLEALHGDYHHLSPPLAADLRESLHDDLSLSGRS